MEPQTVFLVSLLAGNISLVGALGAARWNWRKDIPPFGRQSEVADILLHPDRYAAPRAIPLIRVLGLVGSVLLIIVIASLAYQVAADIRR